MPIKITSKKHLFRRAGVAHPKGTTEYPDGRFSPEQIAALQAEPMLAVEIIETPEPAETSEALKTELAPTEPDKPKKGKK